MQRKPENLTLPGKSVVIKVTLCDRHSEKPSRDSRRVPEGDSGHAPGKNIVCRWNKKTFRRRHTSVRTVALLFGLILVLGFKCLAQDSPPSEYQLKAAFLFNFAKFVEWPSKTFAGPTSPIVIGVLGENVFHGDLEQAIRGKVINNHPLQFKEFHSVTEATNCQILFISPSEKSRLPKILESLHGASVLTVSETERFTEAGGMINFVIEANKVRFQINNEAAKKAGLTISSKLLSLAVHTS